MEPRIVTAQDIDAMIETLDLRAALETMFTALGRGDAVQPAQTLSLFPDGTGDFITYLAVLADERVFGGKLSPYIAHPSGATVTAWTLLMSMDTGTPLLLCDSKRLTTERTAATTALAVDLLAKVDAKVLTLVGTGPVGLAHLRHVERLRSWQEIRLVSRGGLRKAALPAMAGEGIAVTIVSEADEAADGADVVMLCTSSGTPVLDVARIGNGALVTSISTNAVSAHEIDPAALGGLEVYCDYRPNTPLSAGEMMLAAQRHGWDAAKIKGDLPELVIGKASLPTGSQPIFFRSIGLGLEDVAAALAVLKRLSQ